MVATLLAVSELSWQEKQVLLPVPVVNAGGKKLPSSGFYESLTIYRPEDDQSDPETAARRERERVYAVPARLTVLHFLLAFLGALVDPFEVTDQLRGDPVPAEKGIRAGRGPC